MKKHSIFLVISISAFLLTFIAPIFLGIFSKNADDVLMWKCFGLFSVISIVSFLIWIALLIINKAKTTEIIFKSSHQKLISFIAIVVIFIFVLIFLNFL